MIFLKVAFKNLLIRKKRTLVILAAIAVSVAVILFVQGMVEGVKQNFFTNMLEESGHIQILPQGTEDALNPYDLKLLIDKPDDLMQIVRNNPEIIRVEKVLTFGAMLIADDKNLTISGTGTSADTQFFAKAREHTLQGQFLANNKEGQPGISISQRIADLLEVKLGDPVVVLTEDSTGSPWYVEYTVTSLFETKSREFDEGTFFIPHQEAENLLYVPGATRQIRLLLSDYTLAEQVGNNLKKAAGIHPSGTTELKTWEQIHGSYLILIDLFDIFIVFMDIFTVIVAATVITNSILMNVFEHTREYGTLRAIGMKGHQLFGLILTEGFVQGSLGSIAGMMIGIPLVLYFQVNGLDWGEITESFGMGDALYFHLAPAHAAAGALAGVIIACAGSLYAAWVSTRQTIMQSLGAL